ncbi:MAG TPA: hypothetical protein VK459_02200 [Polyangiaceae bacterium]|nr:hypothetical protein [Polyangiaceae bacterium]
MATHERLSVQKVSRIMERSADPQAQEVIVTMLDEIERKGRTEGRARTLLELLEGRFGAVPAKVSAQILAADEATLRTWTGRLLSASTLNDVLGKGNERASTAQRPSARKRSRQA